ncbi:MAG TPA: hypothetical protein VGI70_16400, partial [Polyangiales bacterium]
MTRFRTCEGCSRHVMVSELACPFCKQALAPAPQRPIARFVPGLSRSQRLAIAAAAVTGQAMAACTSEVAEPIYGAPVPTQHGGNGGGGATAGQGATAGHGVAIPVYGAPVAGHVAANGGKGGGGGTGGDGGIVIIPPYGISPPVAGHPSTADDAGVNDAGEVDDAGRP